ncbi:acyl carrier protein [Nocardia macrotermitis]|uniref:Acyl carrier protein n=1 Tax=Nocardia macrotermitis TaxID=2585198 RepID=A0A7K0DA06_9NOCA|nr:phosphopantetheine-binding protein [Nocardia macrotermitis]MQY22606.1 Acyl carrier protein [Nocardia macrotermitis]
MDSTTIRTSVRRIVGQMSPFGAPDEVTADARLVEDLGYDSLAVIELSLRLEKEFDLQLVRDTEQAADIKTIGDIEEFVIARVAVASDAI